MRRKGQRYYSLKLKNTSKRMRFTKTVGERHDPSARTTQQDRK